MTNSDGQSGTLNNGYSYAPANPAPNVSGISPAAGTTAGGTAVTVTGTGFLSGASVKFGSTSASGVNVVSSTSITATAPAHSAGAVNVVVTNTDGQSDSLTNGYSYTNPAPKCELDRAQLRTCSGWDERDHHRHRFPVGSHGKPGWHGSKQRKCREQHLDHGHNRGPRRWGRECRRH